jgi:hypothetical protein
MNGRRVLCSSNEESHVLSHESSDGRDRAGERSLASPWLRMSTAVGAIWDWSRLIGPISGTAAGPAVRLSAVVVAVGLSRFTTAMGSCSTSPRPSPPPRHPAQQGGVGGPGSVSGDVAETRMGRPDCRRCARIVPSWKCQPEKSRDTKTQA